MKVINSVQDSAVLSNVASTSEFKIKNSSRAFQILSSGLYANKIRAIIRELSCNAIDSHQAAGTTDQPFEVHLPTSLSPYFYIRDYGTGLDHHQVLNIYTTYFESTKTESNDYIGALGLGSKSPFSYTDNFLVTAIKDQVKRQYSAFINDQGFPSIALMTESPTTEPSGVQVQFAVNSQNDYYKFKSEAQEVYSWFKFKPSIVNINDFTIPELVYTERDLIPGVHLLRGYRTSYAVMGNIAYPIEIPNTSTNLGNDLSKLLDCGLVLEFDIGELDFQASREGLSYIPQTIQAIKNKLIELNQIIFTRLQSNADAIENLWSRYQFLTTKLSENKCFWHSALIEYEKVTDLPYSILNHKTSIEVYVKQIADLYNVKVTKYTNRRSFQIESPSNKYDNSQGYKHVVDQFHTITMYYDNVFVINDLKSRYIQRIKHNYKSRSYQNQIFLIEAADTTKPADYTGFLDSIYNPLTVVNASSLPAPAPKVKIKPTSIMQLYNVKNNQYAFGHYGDLTDFEDKKTYVYFELSGSTLKSEKLPSTNKLGDLLFELGDQTISNTTYFGVRQSDIAQVRKLSNWIPAEKFIADSLKKITDKQILNQLLIDLRKTDIYSQFQDVQPHLGKDCKLIELMQPVINARHANINLSKLTQLCIYFDVPNFIDQAKTEFNKIKQQLSMYPLLGYFKYSTPYSAIVEYINLIDSINQHEVN